MVACLKDNGLEPKLYPRVRDDLVQVSVGVSEVGRSLQEYIRGTTSGKRLTNKVLEWDRESLLQMLGAYIDGDGHVPTVGKNRGQLRIRSASRSMLLALADAIRAVGIPCTSNWDMSPGWVTIDPAYGEYWSDGSGCVSVSAKFSEEVTCYSRRGFHRPCRRWSAPPVVAGFTLIKVRLVEEVFLQEEVYNLEVEGHHEYVVGEVLVHNCNKDPSQTRGRIPLAAWDPRMHRIEVVAVYDRKRTAALGDQHLLDAIDRGEFFPVSMGARVKHDICTLCGHVSRSTSEYCDHLRTMMGQVLPDGRLVGAVNIRPRFFDLSAVHVPAAKESGIMAKVASEALPGLGHKAGIRPTKISGEKAAEIDKRVLGNVHQKVVEPLTRGELPIPPLLLRRLATYPMERVLPTLGYGGAVLSPREFTCMALHRGGHHDLAGSVPSRFGFPWSYPESRPDPYPAGDVLGELLQVLRSVFTERSVAPQVLIVRMSRPMPGSSQDSMGGFKTATALPVELVAGL